jgi:hypothetical protein
MKHSTTCPIQTYSYLVVISVNFLFQFQFFLLRSVMGFQKLKRDYYSDSDDEQPTGSAEAEQRIAALREENRLLRIEREASDRAMEKAVAERLRLALEKDRLFKDLQERRNRRN